MSDKLTVIESDPYEPIAAKIRDALVGCTAQEAMDILIIVTVQLIEYAVPKERQNSVAIGIASAIAANFLAPPVQPEPQQETSKPPAH